MYLQLFQGTYSPEFIQDPSVTRKIWRYTEYRILCRAFGFHVLMYILYIRCHFVFLLFQFVPFNCMRRDSQAKGPKIIYYFISNALSEYTRAIARLTEIDSEYGAFRDKVAMVRTKHRIAQWIQK